MRLETLIEMLEEKYRQYGDIDVAFMINGVVFYADSHVVVDKEYREAVVAIDF